MISYKLTSILTLLFWYLGIITFFFISKENKLKKLIVSSIINIGTIIFLIYIILLWINLDRAPMRTLGETRLWYSFFLPSIGMIIYYRWKIFWMLIFSIFMATLFILINYFHPDNFDKSLMPALQSYWFVPHVIVYIFAYSLLAFSTLIALRGLIFLWKWDEFLVLKKIVNPSNKSTQDLAESDLNWADNIVYVGFAFLTYGLLFGALWAKEAWGHYWTWDPKETWSFLTWLLYLLYIHYRYCFKKHIKTPLIILTIAFVILLICWFGVNYLPSAQNSVHVYSNN